MRPTPVFLFLEHGLIRKSKNQPDGKLSSLDDLVGTLLATRTPGNYPLPDCMADIAALPVVGVCD